ncbi:MAG: hypothetical protein CVV49_20065 [Spirochaetae bacterium HGW-Spirochaetae-5]|nr:MAG: hypothetical protein CVV49_20065 [Spirochaetae bacterium HGW-Spirochaetae-5]
MIIIFISFFHSPPFTGGVRGGSSFPDSKDSLNTAVAVYFWGHSARAAPEMGDYNCVKSRINSFTSFFSISKLNSIYLYRSSL